MVGEQENLKTMERNFYASTWEDGLLDLFTAVALILIGTGWLADFVILAAVAPAVMVPLWPAARRIIVEPRVGYVEHGAERRYEEHTGMGLLIAAGFASFIAGVILYVMVQRGDVTVSQVLPAVIPALPAVLIAIGAILVASILNLRRFIAYAGVLMAAGAAVAFLDLNPGVAILSGGVFILAWGAVLFARFLSQNPVVHEQQP